MTFSDALERLPVCSYAVERDGDNLVIWFLYWQDAEELGDPKAEDGPWIELCGANVVSDGFGMHAVRDSMPAGDAPRKVRDWEWKEAAVSWDAVPTYEDPATVLHVLNGVPVEDAKRRDGWPEEIRGDR